MNNEIIEEPLDEHTQLFIDGLKKTILDTVEQMRSINFEEAIENHNKMEALIKIMENNNINTNNTSIQEN